MWAPARSCISAANSSSHTCAQECRHHVRASTPTVDNGYTRAPTAPRGDAGAKRRRHLRAVAAAGRKDAGESAGRGEDARTRERGAAQPGAARAWVAVAAERAARRRRAAEACAARPPRSSRIVAAVRCADGGGGGCASSDGDAGTLTLDVEIGAAR
jgi:hypothetical protein